MEKEPKRICDRCDHFTVSPSGCVETCQAKRLGSQVIPHMPDHYIDQRINGNANHCKEFKKLSPLAGVK